MVRHDNPVGATIGRLTRIIGVENAFDNQRPVPFGANEIEIGPGDSRVEIAPHPRHEIVEPGPAFEHRRDIAEMMRPPEQPDIPRPAWPHRALDKASQIARPARRTRQPRPHIAIAATRHRQIDRKHQRAAPGYARLCQQVFHEGAVADHVKLKPERPVRRRRNFGNRADRDSGQRERHPGGIGRAHRLHFTAPRIQPGQPDRRQHHRQRLLHPEQGGGHVDLRNVAQHALAQRDRFEIGDIAAQGHFGIAAAVDVFEQEMRRAPSRRFAKIGN